MNKLWEKHDLGEGGKSRKTNIWIVKKKKKKNGHLNHETLTDKLEHD